MRPCRLSIALGCLASLLLAGSLRASTVAVYLQFDQPPARSSISEMKREIAALMSPAGLSFDWLDLDQRRLGDAFPDLVIVKFRGICDTSAALYGAYSPEATAAAALANTAVIDGKVLPFSSIECDELRRYIAPLTQSDAHSDLALGRALGRVVAHEMFHILASTRGHGGGVAHASQKASDLVAPHYAFDARSTNLLRGYAEKLR